MGFLDDAMDKAKDPIDEHDDKVDDAIEKAGDVVDEKTGNKYAGQIDKGRTSSRQDGGGRRQPVTDPAPRHRQRAPSTGSSWCPPRTCSSCVLPGEDQVLLQLRQNTGFMDDHWAAAAAGHVEKGETAYDAALARPPRRSASPTSSWSSSPPCSAPVGGEPIDERIDFFFTCRSWSGEPRILEPAKPSALSGSRCPLFPTPVVPHELTCSRGLTGGYRALLHLRLLTPDDVPPLVEEGALAPVSDQRP